MRKSSAMPRATGASSGDRNRPGDKWSGRSTLLFLLAAGLVSWALLITKAVLIF